MNNLTRPLYKADHIDRKLYTNSWGNVDFTEKSIHIAALLNDYDSKGYELFEIITGPDALGGTNEIYVFKLKDS